MHTALLKTTLRSAFILVLFSVLFSRPAKAQFPGYTMVNYINNVVQYPVNFAAADPVSITDTLLTTCWYNIGYPSGADLLMMTWNTPFFNGPGEDILIAIWDNNASGGANVRLQLSDNSYTPYVYVDFLSGLVNSNNGVISPVGYNRITNSITSYPNTPRAKLLDISSFYNGPFAVKGIEFSGFTVSYIDLLAISSTQNATPLPLTLLSFSCNSLGGSVQLQWQTSDEINTSHFDIERSTDGIVFEKAGTVAASGHSKGLRLYNYSEAYRPASAYYRLKMTDLDGQFTYSSIRKVINGQHVQQVSLHHNPSKYEVLFSGAEPGTGYSLRSITGQQLKFGEVTSQQTRVDTRDLSPGIYILRFSNPDLRPIQVQISN